MSCEELQAEVDFNLIWYHTAKMLFTCAFVLTLIICLKYSEKKVQ